MNSKKSVVKTSTKKVINAVKVSSEKAPKLQLKAIAESDLKVADRKFLSCVIGQLAFSDRYELPLTVSRTNDGLAVQAYSLANVERAFYALHNKFNGKVTIALEKREAQEGAFFVIVIAKSAKKCAVKFEGEVKDKDLKLPASSKRAKKAQAKKLDALQEAREKRKDDIAALDETAKKQLDLAQATKEKRALALKQGDGKKATALLADETASLKIALMAQVKACVIKRIPTIDDKTADALANDIYSIVK